MFITLCAALYFDYSDVSVCWQHCLLSHCISFHFRIEYYTIFVCIYTNCEYSCGGWRQFHLYLFALWFSNATEWIMAHNKTRHFFYISFSLCLDFKCLARTYIYQHLRSTITIFVWRDKMAIYFYINTYLFCMCYRYVWFCVLLSPVRRYFFRACSFRKWFFGLFFSVFLIYDMFGGVLLVYSLTAKTPKVVATVWYIFSIWQKHFLCLMSIVK